MLAVCKWNLMGQTYCWEIAKSEDAQQRGLSASTITNYDELPTTLSVILPDENPHMFLSSNAEYQSEMVGWFQID